MGDAAEEHAAGSSDVQGVPHRRCRCCADLEQSTAAFHDAPGQAGGGPDSIPCCTGDPRQPHSECVVRAAAASSGGLSLLHKSRQQRQVQGSRGLQPPPGSLPQLLALPRLQRWQQQRQPSRL